MTRYLFRIDDVTPTMNEKAVNACLELFAASGVRPILGIVPDNRDPLLDASPPSASFWETTARLAREKKITVAQHGLHHAYHRHPRSLLRKYGGDDLTEFAGLSFERQLEKIERGKAMLEARGLSPVVWMAPNHSFDRVTLRALSASGFRYVTDGVGFYPYRRGGLVFFPALSGKPRRVPCGLATICLHPNTMTEADFARLRSFLASSPRVIAFEEALAYRNPWFAGIANLLCRIAFFIVKSTLRLGRRGPAPRPESSAGAPE